MRKRYQTNRQLFLFNMIAFIGFSFEFYIRGDSFFGSVMIFVGLMNLIAYQQAPRRIATITVMLNLFNALVAATVCYNYVEEDYMSLLMIWVFLALAYFVATIRQVFGLVRFNRAKKKHKRKFN